MIQRIQTLWLLIVAVLAGITYFFPLWSGLQANGEVKKLLAAESLLFLAINSFVFILSIAGIFLFKNRTKQKFTCLLGILLSVILIALEYDSVNNYKKDYTFSQSTWEFSALSPLLMIFFFFLAYRGISKDQALLKEGDRLR